jgi:hypothetical protein
MAEKLTGSAIQTGTITTTQLSTTVVNNISAGGGPKISSLTYPGDDTAANTAGGQVIRINGSGFASNSTVYLNGNAVPSVTYNSSSNLVFTTPALSAATYLLYVINPEDGGTAIFVPGLQVSGEPTWSTSATLPEQGVDDAWSISLSATSDSNVSYTLAGGSSLPSGISLAANGLISGTLSSPPNDDTTYNFTAVAIDAENQDASRAFSVNVTVGEGVPFANTVLLLHGDGTNNQNNHTFLDSSDNNFTITRNGNATQGSFSPFSQTGWSGYFDGTGDFLTAVGSGSVVRSSGSFTIEGWYYPTSSASSFRAVYSSGTGYATAGRLYQNNTSLTFYWGPSSSVAGSIGWTLNTWNHFAVTWNGTTTKVYVNGQQSISTTGATYSGTTDISIGESTYSPFGYISNFRIANSVIYTANFTPPSEPLTNIADTSLLTLQSNRFVDNSNNNFTITRNGDTRIVPYSPFAPTSKYTTAAVGGSGYFDGSGDYIRKSGSGVLTSSGDVTIECWAYPLSSSVIGLFDGGPNQGSILRNYPSNAIGKAGGSSISFTMTQNAWNHLALTVTSAGTATLYINGTSVGTSSFGSYGGGSNFDIGTINGGGDGAFNGYISNFRVTKSIVYNENFTPPTAPLTNIANTSLLCNFTNAGIFDSTAKNVLETVGDAKISTAQYKYGTGSMVFDGTGDYLEVKENKQLFNFKAGNFTIEMWYYANAHGGGLIGKGPSDSDDEMFIYLYSGVYYVDWGGVSGAYMQGGSYSLNQWNHLALVRNGTSLVLYHNGTSAVSTTLSANYNFTGNHTLKIGSARGGSFNYNGYIDDLRISRFARYTSNFTPPTSAFKDR